MPGPREGIANGSLTEPFVGGGGHLLWGWRPGAGDTSRMQVVTGLDEPAQALATDPASVALGPLSKEADVSADGHASPPTARRDRRDG